MLAIYTGTRHPGSGDVGRVWSTLHLLLVWAKAGGEQLKVVHGDGRGIDQAADLWCRRAIAAGEPVEVKPYPARWYLHGRRAGLLRNENMWTENWYYTDLCVSFPAPDSIGTVHCAELAERHGVPVWSNPIGQSLNTPPAARLIPSMWART